MSVSEQIQIKVIDSLPGTRRTTPRERFQSGIISTTCDCFQPFISILCEAYKRIDLMKEGEGVKKVNK